VSEEVPLHSTSGLSRVSDPRRDAVAAAVVIAVALLAIWMGHTPASRSFRIWFGGADRTRGLAKALGSRRPIKARLAGGFSYAPFQEAVENEREPTVDFRLAAAEIERAAIQVPDAPNLHQWGKAQLLSGTVDAAIDTLEAAVVIDARVPDLFNDVAAAYMTRALRDGHAADWPQALEAVDRAIELDSTIPEPFFNKALILEALGLRDGAEAAWRAYLERDRTSQWSAEVTWHLDTMRNARMSVARSGASDCNDDWSDGWYEAADRALGQWARLTIKQSAAAEVSSDATRVAKCLEQRAGERYYARVVQLASAGGVALAHSLASLDSAESARQRADLVSAAALATAIEGHLPVNHPIRLRAELILASRLYNDGRMIDATKLLLDLIDAARREGYQAIGAEATGTLGAVFYAYGDYEQSLARHSESVSMYQRVRLGKGLASAELFTAEAARALGDYDTAWEHYLKAFANQDMLTSVARRQSLANSPMIATMFQGLPRASLDFGASALARAHSTGNPVSNCDAGLNVARANARIERIDAARDLLASAAVHCRAISDPGLRVRASAELNAVTADVFASIDPRQSEAAARAALRFYEQAVWQQRYPQMFQTLGIALRRQGRHHEAEDAFARGINVIEAYQSDVANRAHRISYLDSVWDLYGAQVQTALELGDVRSAFETADRGVGRTMRSAAPASLDALQSQMRAGEAMLLSVVLDDRVVLFALTRDGVRVAQRPTTRERLLRTVRWLSPTLSSPELAEHARTAARMLSTTLLAPFEEMLGRSSVLYIVADPLLQSIPYSFLPWSANVDQLLVDRLPVVMCPSASACLGESGSTSAIRSGPVAILRQSGGEYLPRLDWEVGEIAKLYRQATVLDATPSQLRAQLAAADIIHYAGHAFVDPGFSRWSALLLRPDDGGTPVKVSVTDLVTEPIHARLIVLSACSTLRGRIFRGEGMVAASTVFLAGGALNVVGTLWDVRDEAASTLMVAFHEQLSRGVAPARALWLAQNVLRRSGRPPLDWAFPVLITRDAHSM
jgi:CHAT domain-containing protein